MELRIGLMCPRGLDTSREAIAALPFGREEIDRLSRIGNPEFREQSLGALLALRTLLEHAGLTPLPIVREDRGKPYFAGETPPHFNLSHTDGICAAALSPSPVGIDVELLRPDRSMDAIAGRFFDEEERAAWCEHPSPERFYELWTKKEALAKLSGEGLPGKGRKEGYFRSARLTLGGRVAYLCVATEQPIERILWIHHIKELAIHELP